MIFSLINLKTDIREITYILDDIVLNTTETYFQLKMINSLLIFTTILFITGLIILGLNKQNLIILIMGVELILLSVFLNFIAFSILNGTPDGHVYSLIVITLSAAEAAIGLGLFIAAYKIKKSLNFIAFDELNT
jgi:NADH:ubiquinone oxidoreductase subunit K